MRIVVSILLFLCCGSAFPVWAEPVEIGEKGCKECHRFSSHEKKFYKGPDLFYAGNKYYQIWLENFLQSPTVIRELAYSSQPGLLEKKTKINRSHILLTKDESKRVSKFLMTLRISGLEMGKVDKKKLSKICRIFVCYQLQWFDHELSVLGEGLVKCRVGGLA